jgi:uncharacterized peroxidase-related enzyme
MPHISMPPEIMPGTPGLMRYRPETGRPLSQLAEVLLRDAHSLSRAERELIAAHVSAINECRFCLYTHSEMSAQQHPEGRELVDKALADPASAPISPKLKALLAIAEAVQQSGHAVTKKMVETARAAGGTDTEIHDTVLIAAAFGMYNRYCDGLAAVVPEDPATYIPMAAMIIREGYSQCATGH